jgi:ribose 5-phosphate isomerase A
MTTSGAVEDLKHEAALRALEYVRDGMALGLGSGSTAEIFLAELGRRVQAGLRVVGVPTSRQVEAIARRLGVPVTSLDDHARLDLTVDGADEIEPRTLNLIKGHGGALLREKLVATATAQEIIIADETKLVATLGQHQPVPVEVIPFGWRHTAERLAALDCRPTLRRADGEPFVSDEGHYILDCQFPPIAEPEPLGRAIKAIVGVVEHGIFVGLAHRAIVAGRDGVRFFEPGIGELHPGR